MSHSDDGSGKIVPAQLNFLAIYNPDLATTDATEQDQIVFYYSRTANDRPKRRNKSAGSEAEGSNEANEQLRQVGLAQGMVAFAREFSNGAPVDSVETERHRIILKELENEWWILASIDLTRIPSSKSSSESNASKPQYEYSSREVSPPVLLIKQLQRAHRIFLLHQGRSLDDLFIRLTRDNFCELLNRFWTKFALTWDVLLHGNPSTDVYSGIKLATGGELGIGVGEEEWGSGERDVLEGLVRNTDGLVDMTVSRFGNPMDKSSQGESRGSTRDKTENSEICTSEKWMGNGQDPGLTDGMVFSGLGTMTRPGLRTLTEWVSWIYTYGEEAYGVVENPNSARRKRKRRKPRSTESDIVNARQAEAQDLVEEKAKEPRKSSSHKTRPDIPPPIVTAAEVSLKEATSSIDKSTAAHVQGSSDLQAVPSNAFGSSEQWVKVLTLGYGSVWGGSSRTQEDIHSNTEVDQKAVSTAIVRNDTKKQDIIAEKKKPLQNAHKLPSTSAGYFIVGLKGNLDVEDEPLTTNEGDIDTTEGNESGPTARLSLRTLHIEMWEEQSSNEDEDENQDQERMPFRRATTRVQVVIYVHPPFVYTLLFRSSTTSLSFPSFFHDLHHHLTPLHGPLLRSTSPRSIAARLQANIPNASSPIFDLIHSPQSLTTHCSIPNIPAPGTLAAEGLPDLSSANKASDVPSWTRLEALNVHSQILNTYADTRTRAGELERTAKTGRGWWVVWMKVHTMGSTKSRTPLSSVTSSAAVGEEDPACSEAILVRKASEPVRSKGTWTLGSYGSSASRRATYGGTSALSRLVGRESSGSGSDASVPGGAGSSGKLAEGIGMGVDPQKYVETLLSLCR